MVLSMPTKLVMHNHNPMTNADDIADLNALAAESIGWQPLGEGAYLHHGDVDETQNVIHVVGIPETSMAGVNVLLLT